MILLVEDHPELRAGYQLFLKIHGFTVITAETGKSALAKIEKHPDVRLVVMDLGLPDMGGLEVLATIRANSLLKELPVIVHSAYEDKQQKAMEAGASAFVRKDGINVDVLLEVIRKQLALVS